MFEKIIGNEQVKKFLTRMVDADTVGNSLLFAGPEGIGKSLFAFAFAKLLICSHDPEGKHRQKIDNGNHPDIRVYRPEGKIGMHSIASLRQLSEEVYLAPYEAKWKVFMIHDAERMLTYSANALLKTFEEPLPNSVIILLSSAPASLLPTVRSRCRTIFFNALTDEEIVLFLQKAGKSPEEAKEIAAFAQGSIGHASRLIQGETNTLRKTILETLIQGHISTYKNLSELAAKIAEQVDESKEQIEEETRKFLLNKSNMQDLTAVQKQSLEKEIEGSLATRLTAEAHVIFDIILGWYRDLCLLQVNGNRAHLIHKDFASQSEQVFQQSKILSIETVQKAISEARLSLERSTSLNLCLESLFLKLNLLK